MGRKASDVELRLPFGVALRIHFPNLDGLVAYPADNLKWVDVAISIVVGVVHGFSFVWWLVCVKV
jgi:hypothetical protein